MVVSSADHAVVLFHHEAGIYAVDNRCPHMGFPLSFSKGTVEPLDVGCPDWDGTDQGPPRDTGSVETATCARPRERTE